MNLSSSSLSLSIYGVHVIAQCTCTLAHIVFIYYLNRFPSIVWWKFICLHSLQHIKDDGKMGKAKGMRRMADGWMMSLLIIHLLWSTLCANVPCLWCVRVHPLCCHCVSLSMCLCNGFCVYWTQTMEIDMLIVIPNIVLKRYCWLSPSLISIVIFISFFFSFSLFTTISTFPDSVFLALGFLSLLIFVFAWSIRCVSFSSQSHQYVELLCKTKSLVLNITLYVCWCSQ